ncbi:hypothetical protein KTT_18620 [Tengunoibacter tsumagoiensis]|uniref:Uncharacterized protein n=1 Tax=Tengunoibacter tsumagoiensis TaxID=2014871 RepID=A0A401ZYU7_9CHLR|nr:hypothetical protein KTT_18620 [Tengunoibacter tsumagoiensis]
MCFESRHQFLKENEVDVAQLQLERFPCIDDFEVVMRAPSLFMYPGITCAASEVLWRKLLQ